MVDLNFEPLLISEEQEKIVLVDKENNKAISLEISLMDRETDTIGDEG